MVKSIFASLTDQYLHDSAISFPFRSLLTLRQNKECALSISVVDSIDRQVSVDYTNIIF